MTKMVPLAHLNNTINYNKYCTKRFICISKYISKVYPDNNFATINNLKHSNYKCNFIVQQIIKQLRKVATFQYYTQHNLAVCHLTKITSFRSTQVQTNNFDITWALLGTLDKLQDLFHCRINYYAPWKSRKITFQYYIYVIKINWAATRETQLNDFGTSMDPDQPAKSDLDLCWFAKAFCWFSRVAANM